MGYKVSKFLVLFAHCVLSLCLTVTVYCHCVLLSLCTVTVYCHLVVSLCTVTV